MTRTLTPPHRFHRAALAAAASGALLLQACASLQGPAEGVAAKPPAAALASPATTAPPAAAAPAPVAVAGGVAAANGTAPRPAFAPPPGITPGGPPPFGTVIKDARRIDGPLTLWQKDDKVWIELLPEQLGKPFLLSPKIRNGIGEAWVLGGLMAFPVNGAGGQQVVEFVRVHNQMRLQALNTDVIAKVGSPEERAVRSSYSNSLLGAVPVISQPHPDRKSVLIEANGLFLTDMLGVGMMLQRGLRQGYGLDRSNSVITAVRGSEVATIIETENHFFSGGVGAPGQGGALGALLGSPSPALPRYLPDSRSMLVGLHFSLAPLPEQPMATRRADPRIGLFSTTVLDFSNDLTTSPRQRYINRWRLEKKDPAAEMSEPVKPITFWIDRNVPVVYRETVRAAILEWNKAFEKVGISQAIRVEQQPDDAKFDTLDFGVASVRWMMNAEPSFGAIGPSHIDPRTGEILDADIAFEGMAARGARTLRARVLPGAASSQAIGTGEGAPALDSTLPMSFATPISFFPGADASGNPAQNHAYCQHANLAAEQLGYALDVMQARGDLDPDGPLARQFVLDYVKEAIMHEVGHTLGLRHNFRASRAYTEAQLADAEFTRANGTTGSVMEYTAVNLPSPGQTGGVPFQTALGPYDYWAVEYAYKPMAPGATPAAQQAELQRIAARSNEPLLAYGTDEDNAFGIDPETLQLDLGADPIAFASKRLAIARDLFKRQEARELSPTSDYSVLRRSVAFAVGDVTRAVGVLVRQIGGVRTLRDYPGSGREPLQPVPAALQREALSLVSSAVLAPEGLSLSPALQRRLAPDYLDRAEALGGSTDFLLPQRLLDLQRAVLAYLMSDSIAVRVLDSVGKVDRGADAFQLSELYQHLADNVWRELSDSQSSITAERRDLQRDHLNRLSLAVVRPGGAGRADARGLLRLQARQLLVKLEGAQRRSKADEATRAHLSDSLDTLRQALAATLQRQSL